jgi:hypothetical protein
MSVLWLVNYFKSYRTKKEARNKFVKQYHILRLTILSYKQINNVTYRICKHKIDKLKQFSYDCNINDYAVDRIKILERLLITRYYAFKKKTNKTF